MGDLARQSAAELIHEYEAGRQLLGNVINLINPTMTFLFGFSDEDIAYAQREGDLPEGATPLTVQLAMMNDVTPVHTPKWLLAKRLRDLADKMEKEAENEFNDLVTESNRAERTHPMFEGYQDDGSEAASEPDPA